jgi:putative aldouronate transport system permease protein
MALPILIIGWLAGHYASGLSKGIRYAAVGKNERLWSKEQVMIISGAISTFNLILMKNFFQQLPVSLEEAAKIDGANDLVIFAKIYLPLSLPAVATFTLFYAVGHWNSFMAPLLYINDSAKWPIQVLLRQIIMLSQGGVGDEATLDAQVVIPPQTVKMACIVVATAPILLVYPFLQKYFVKGVMMGSIKG